MTALRTVAAVDLGAESGRVTSVSFDGRHLSVDLVNRFPNQPRTSQGFLRWDTAALWSSIVEGLGVLAGGDRAISSVGVDTWGVDYGVLAADGQLLDDPISYRDTRNTGAHAAALAQLGAERIYGDTGVQILPINTLFALMADVADNRDRLSGGSTLLMMPDIFHHRMSGSLVSEYTAVSTTGAYDMANNRWATGLLDALSVPTHMLPEVVPPGTDVGALLGPLSTGQLSGARVIVPAAHDTASAVVGVPFATPGGLFISSGTWSLVGVETSHPVISGQTQRFNLTNEGGYSGSIRLLRNVMGLWILQECRRQWAGEGLNLNYGELAMMAAAEPGLVSLIDPDAAEFLPPGDMPTRIRNYCAAAGMPVPHSPAAVTRCVIDSLALSYCAVINDISAVTGSFPLSVNIVGGGANNVLLSQLTADATSLPVHCGPTEATALGNGAVQLAALGEFAGPAEIRRAILDGSKIVSYEPRPAGRWLDALDTFQSRRNIDESSARASPST